VRYSDGICEGGYEPSGFEGGGEFLEQLSDYRFVRKNSGTQNNGTSAASYSYKVKGKVVPVL
jgi:hypothetical protein